MFSKFLLSTALLLCASAAQAITIVSVTGPNQFGTTNAMYMGSANGAVGFSTASDYVNVSISVSFIGGSNGASDMTLDAFLTNQVGTGTTAGANQIASSSQQVTVAPSPTFPLAVTEVTVLSGLNLSAGTYYLTLAGTGLTDYVAWVNALNGDLTTTLDTGAAVVAAFLRESNQFPPSYIPATNFLSDSGRGLWFNVTGDPANVPEPASLTMLAGGLALACLCRRRK